MTCAGCKRGDVEVCRSQEHGLDLCLRCYVRNTTNKPVPMPSYEAPRPQSVRVPTVLDRLEAQLVSHGLPVVHVGMPGKFGSLCPLCAAGMAVEHNHLGGRFVCGNGCTNKNIASHLAVPPTPRRTAA